MEKITKEKENQKLIKQIQKRVDKIIPEIERITNYYDNCVDELENEEIEIRFKLFNIQIKDDKETGSIGGIGGIINMGKIVTFYSTKGGQGKTTLAINYAIFSNSIYYTNDYKTGTELYTKIFYQLINL
jgi:hypothetical protein